MHYAREVFERRNLNADQTIAGGPFVDLGGFQNFVHNQNIDTPVKMSFDIDFEDTGLPDYGTVASPGAYHVFGEPLVGNIKRAMVLVTISWSRQNAAPYVSEYVVWLDDQWFGTITQEPGRVGCSLCINPAHPSLLDVSDVETLNQSWGADPETAESALLALILISMNDGLLSGLNLGEVKDGGQKQVVGTIPIAGQKDALPIWDRRLSFPFDLEDKVTDERGTNEITLDRLSETISQLMVGPGQLVRDALLGFRYLGPLRETPDRDHVPPRWPTFSKRSSTLAKAPIATWGPSRWNRRHSMVRDEHTFTLLGRSATSCLCGSLYGAGLYPGSPWLNTG